MRAACAGALLVAAALALAVAADPLPQRELTAYASEADSDDESDEAPRSDGDELPAELLVSEYLFAGETKTFLFHKPKSDGPLSITVTPCTSSILWSVALRPDSDDSGPLPSPSPAPGVAPGAAPSWVAPPPGETALGEFRGRELRTLRLAPGGARAGAYAVRVRALERDSFVQLFASERAAGGGGGGGGGAASAVPAPGRTRLRLRRRRRPGHRLTVRWEPSQVDPHLTRYCLVVNPRRRYSTLCEARGELLSAGPPPPSTSDESAVRRKQRKDDKAPKKDKGKAKDKGKGHAPASVSVEKHEVGGLQAHNDIIIGCVGKRTQYTVSGLVPGRLYHFDLFAVNRRTNLSLPYGNAEMRFDARARPTALRDARAASVNLKSLDGRAAFRFKVPRPANGSAPGDLLLYVMPCGGGAVDVRAQLQQPREGSGGGGGGGGGGAPGAVREVARARVEGFAALRVPAPPPGARLVLRAATPNAEELRRVSALEVFATTRAERFPFPTLPTPARLHEYDSLRRCDSVTVGWLPSAAPPGWLAPAPAPANASADASAAPPRLRYCVTAREARPRDLETGRRADQCGLDARLRRTAAAAAAAASQDAPVRVCSDHEAAVAPPPLATLPPKKGAGGRTEAPAAEPGAVTTMALRRLRPGRAYTVQLTVQRLPAGRSLSYDLLPVHTKPSCA